MEQMGSRVSAQVTEEELRITLVFSQRAEQKIRRKSEVKKCVCIVGIYSLY